MVDTLVILELFLKWVPVFVFLGLFFWIVRRSKHPKTGISQFEYLERGLAEQKRHNAQLEKILENMNRRLDLLERDRSGSGSQS